LDTAVLIDLVLNQASQWFYLMRIKRVSLMRKALLFIKVVLLLTAFVGVSNIYAADFGSKNFFASSVCDLNASLGNQQSTSDDDADVASEYHFLSLSSASFVSVDYAFVTSDIDASRPFARAPPAHF